VVIRCSGFQHRDRGERERGFSGVPTALDDSWDADPALKRRAIGGCPYGTGFLLRPAISVVPFHL